MIEYNSKRKDIAMRKRGIVVCVIIICFFVSGLGIHTFMQKEQNEIIPADIGSAAKESALALKDSGSKGIYETDSGQETEDVVMSIMGKSVDKVYFDYRASLYAACGSRDPVKEAENLIKRQVAQQNFAEKYNLVPSEQEIAEYCNSIRQQANSDPESRKIMSDIIGSMGLTEDEYFNIIQPGYEVPYVIVEQNVAEYCEKNDLDVPDGRKAEVNHKDTAYLRELSLKYHVS